MGYFRELPNFEYLSPLSERNSASEYVPAKNLFKRVKLRDDFYNSFTNFEKYQITEGERPDQVALELYGSAQLDWVVLISANIVNVRDQWPLSNKDMYDFVENAYGDEMNSVRFYETIEVKDSKGRLVMPEKQVVDRNFKSPRPTTETAESYVQFWDSGLEQVVTKYNIHSLNQCLFLIIAHLGSKFLFRGTFQERAKVREFLQGREFRGISGNIEGK